ncbi:ABC transporter substrate-binding protein [Bordetella genomosp. 12]|uniref:ABC transporter permease n=1 Tax=Bordetella genomosp. 12 TaxID=463035 RepID=A0A261VUL5_9BORD|nr:ABC transporter substrate-binding protein [Bordetella genomosp. 12]OZI77729.1 ABC transporter permease [Bordetella genomosp. 12]
MGFAVKRLGIAAAVAAAFLSPLAAHAAKDVVRIGFITDMSGVYSDFDGPGGVEAIRMAIADMGGSVNGKKIELVTADHQNKADIAASKAREWFDQQDLDLLIGGTNSSATLAMAKIAGEKKKVFISAGSGTTRMTNEECNPYSVQYVYDTAAAARVAGNAIAKQGGKSWFYITADVAFGTSLEKELADTVKANGGTVIGSVRHPLGMADFASLLLQAQSSKAQVLGLATGGGDLINAIKSASEFGINKKMQIAAPLMLITDIHALGLKQTQGFYYTDGWYWDQSPESRAWAKRYFEKMKKMPSMYQAGDASAAMHYLKAVQAVGDTDADKVMAKMREMPVEDFFAKGGVIRPDGRMVHDMFLMQVKEPAESKYPWDYAKLVQTVPGSQAFMTKAESSCQYWK